MPRRLTAAVFFVISAVLLPAAASAQSFDPRLSVRLGITDAGGNKGLNVYYPEIELENRLHAFEDIKVSLDGSVFAGYWNAGLEESSCEDHGDYCQRNVAMGGRLRVTPERVFIPISFFGELSYHIQKEKGRGRARVFERQFDYAGVGGGVRLDIPLIMSARLIAQLQAHVPLTERNVPLNNSFTIGINFPL